MPAAKVTIERRAIRNARLRVSSSGMVGLIVPEHFTEAQINGLLARKAGWIEEKRCFFARSLTIKHHLSPNELRLFGDTFLYVNTPTMRFGTVLDFRGRMVRTGIDLSNAESRRKWYRRFARNYLRQRIEEVSRLQGFSYQRLYVRAPWGHWGSCSAKRNISLNWRLIEAPKEVIDYVILHELLHTRLMNHDHGFWAHLRAICPNVSTAREWLARNRPD